jgi:predicted ATPase
VLELGRALSLTQSGSFSGSLASLLQSRLDMVEAPARLLLAQAALTGEATWERLLLELAAGNEQDLVAELVDQDLLVRETRSTVPEDIEYRFQSELLRQAVLRMIPFSDRPLLHLKIATWLESHAPLSFSELIAEHFERGGSPDAAYAHYLAAADQADAHGDPERANDLYERLLGLDLGADQLAEGALAYANAALARGDRARAIAALTRAHAWIEQSAAGERDELERVEQRLRGDAEALA